MYAIKSFVDGVVGKVYCVAECLPGGRWVALSYHGGPDGLGRAEMVLAARLGLESAGRGLEETVAALVRED